jgi:hypothetical protein
MTDTARRRPTPPEPTSIGLALVVALTAAGAGIYDAVAEHDGISSLDQPALEQSIALRTSHGAIYYKNRPNPVRRWHTLRTCRTSGDGRRQPGKRLWL